MTMASFQCGSSQCGTTICRQARASDLGRHSSVLGCEIIGEMDCSLGCVAMAEIRWKQLLPFHTMCRCIFGLDLGG